MIEAGSCFEMFSFPLNDNDNLDDSILVVIDTFDSVDGGCGLRFSYSVRQLDTDEQLYDILNGRNSSTHFSFQVTLISGVGVRARQDDVSRVSAPA